ncbi:MAG: 50S ribosomal protein L25 [Ilumatobacteraceae bacterium]
MTTILNTHVGRTIGSAESRRLLAQDRIPAVLYGHGMQPVPITVERRELRVALSGPAGTNTILELQVGDKTYPAVVKEMQRDPAKRGVRHVDFMQIDLSEEIIMAVPVHLTGIAKAVLAEGGLVDPTVDRIEVRAAANNIPNEILIDVTSMGMDDVIRLGDIELPKGVTAVADADLVIVTVLVTKVETEAAVAAPVEGEALAGAAAPVAGTPTTGDSKPAAS